MKVRNLSDINNLHNAQDVILLYEVIENRFQLMHDKYGFNPRKCNYVSTSRDYIECNLLEVIIPLPTSNEAVECREKN